LPTASTRTLIVAPRSPELDAVRALWRKDSDTLGLFPKGAFVEYAARGRIIAATDGGTVVGYLAYRVALQRAAIVHLCVAAPARGQGIARVRFEAFRDRTRDAHGALVRCREDYAASALWPKLGFRVADERDARKAGKRLRVWWLDYGAADLFRALARSLPAAVVDANIFFDLLTPKNPRSTGYGRTA
jgi:GNAT superfamily N-acetyltransferase